MLWQRGLLKMSNILGPGELEIEPLDPCPQNLREYTTATVVKGKVLLAVDDRGGSAYNIGMKKWHQQSIP